ncbi:uncharacterized protein LOC125028649 [Penaeus chinensis]|uniref:uncharacterized protein LOC125028649 n=1 Tax=Penaeus chinensis TaxID=139456 RepID=UPI001FB7F3CD|nr:uncharacterized protein LOC125028649 [Penaeus chinensis]
MAPIQKHFSSHVEDNTSSASSKNFKASSSFHTVKTSSFQNSAISRESKTSTNSDQPQKRISHTENQADREVMLPIISRGHFHHDSFFENLRQQFDTAVQDMLDLWNSRSSFEDDLLSYRRMRDLNLTEENQAVSVSQDNTSHQVVIDVRNFMDGDIKVKVVDDSELVIEGSVEKRQDGSVSKSTFCRRFSFPGLLSEDTVSSSMSADGVLTVTVPKKSSLTNREGRTIKITTSHKNSADATNTHKNITNNVEAKQVSVEEKSSKSSQVNVEEDQAQSTESQNTKDSSESMEAKPFASFHLLPISERGPFFRDSFFQDTRQQFQQAVDKVLKEWGQLDSASDHMDMYRNLRKHNLQEENQAVAFNEDHQCYKIVVDVQDFKEGDVKVKVVDENELTIEGNLEINRDDSVSSKSFFRRFCFPGLVSADTVRSGVSSDGILTVTVPKKTSRSKSSAVSEAQVSKTSSQSTGETLTANTKSEKQSCRSEYQNTCSKRSEVASSSSLTNKIISEEKQEKQEKDAHNKIGQIGSMLAHNIQSSKDAVDKCLSISSKGQFFSDSFFEDVRKDFETAVNEVLSRHDIMGSANDELSCYRSLRERELKDETQAMKTTDDQNGFKVVLDVRDFMNEDVKVKVVDNKEVVVEGRTEKSDGTLRSSKSFCRRFTFPGAVDMSAVTSAMSSDGVLTITAPKREEGKGTRYDIIRKSKMAPIQKRFSSHVEDNTSSTSSKNFKASSSFHIVKTSSSQNSAIASESKTTKNSDQPQKRISHTENQADREVMLPIISRGHFHHDSFFENLRQQFDTAVRDMLNQCNSRSSFEDDLLSYRRMRDLSLTEENQAVSVSQDNTSHQVVIDVRDFMDGDIKVKVVDDSELVIEGSVEKRQDGSVSKSTFCRRFSFPGLLSEDTVSSSMSADGVLTVTVPKKSCLTNREGRTIKITTSHKSSADATNTHKNITNNVEAKQVSVEEKSSKSSQVKVEEDQAQSTESQNTKDSSESMEAKPFASFHLLPISERGPFFRDSFFQDTRQQFQQAVDKVLKEWGQLDSASDHMDMYRNLRKHNLQEENQAVAFNEDHQCYKIVVDVQDFKEGDVKVKVVDENELTIEGNLEIKQDDSVSSKSFFRRFCFPGLVSADTVRSGVSSDGILTVTVPKKTSRSKPSAVSEAQVSQTSSQSTEETLTEKTKSEKQSCRSEYQNSCTRRSEVTSSSSPMNKIISEGKQEKQEKDARNKIGEIISMLAHNIQSSKDAVDDKCLSISSKGQFFSDSFFEDVRKDFETAVNEVLSRHDIIGSANDELSCYRSLRERELKDETQAMKTTDDQNGFKVVLDVHDFMNEDVKVKVVDNKEVVVEGRAEKSDGTSRSSKSFCRRFTFPEAVDMNAVTSAMSSDGVLTISAPKI